MLPFDLTAHLFDSLTDTKRVIAALNMADKKSRTPTTPYPNIVVKSSSVEGIEEFAVAVESGVNGVGDCSSHSEEYPEIQIGFCFNASKFLPTTIISPLLQLFWYVELNSTYPDGDGWKQVLFTSS